MWCDEEHGSKLRRQEGFIKQTEYAVWSLLLPLPLNLAALSPSGPRLSSSQSSRKPSSRSRRMWTFCAACWRRSGWRSLSMGAHWGAFPACFKASNVSVSVVRFFCVCSGLGESSTRIMVSFMMIEKEFGMHNELEKGSRSLQGLLQPWQLALQ